MLMWIQSESSGWYGAELYRIWSSGVLLMVSAIYRVPLHFRLLFRCLAEFKRSLLQMRPDLLIQCVAHFIFHVNLADEMR